MTSLGEIAQPSECSLTHTLLAYWRKLLMQQHDSPGERQRKIVVVLLEPFSDLMAPDLDAFGQKLRKMAADELAFYRGSACRFYADVDGTDCRSADA